MTESTKEPFRRKIDIENISVPDDITEKWQKIVNLMGKLINVPVALIMKVDQPYIEVFISSDSKGNPYKIGDREHLAGLYCEKVITSKQYLLVPNALKDQNWNKNPDIKLGMISYLGYPIVYPDDSIFGTICVLDTQENKYSSDIKDLIFNFKQLIEQDLSIIVMSNKLEIQQQNTRVLFDNATTGIAYHEIIYDSSGKPIDYIIKNVNSQYEEIISIKKEKVIGKQATKVYKTEKAPYLEIYSSVSENMESVSFETYFKPMDKYFRISAIPLRKGEFITVFDDISEEKITQEKLKDSESRFRRIFRNLPIGMEIYDSNGKLIDINDPCLNIFGIIDKSQLSEFNLFDDPNLPNKEKKELKKFKMVHYEAKFDFEKVKKYKLYETSKSGYIYIHVIILPLFSEDKERVINYLVIVQDITARKNAEINLKKSEKKYKKAFEEANFYRDLFTHDISNIIQVIHSSIDIYFRLKSKSEKRELADDLMNRILKNTDKAIELINTVRKITKIDESLILPLQEIDVGDFLNDAIYNVRQLFKKKEIKVEVKSRIENLTVLANDLLLEAFENIINNGIKYNKNDPVEISVKISSKLIDDKKYITIEFLDNGTGVEDEHKEKIFKKGYKRIKSEKGMGMGLSLVRELIEGFNGKIWIENRIKEDYTKGSNFIILLPAVK